MTGTVKKTVIVEFTICFDIFGGNAAERKRAKYYDLSEGAVISEPHHSGSGFKGTAASTRLPCFEETPGLYHEISQRFASECV